MLFALAVPEGAEYRHRGLDMGRVGLDGQFALEHVVPGTYGIVAFLPGYLTPFDGMVQDSSPGGNQRAEAELMKRLGVDTIHVGADGTVNHDVVLERGATVSGRVQYADGAPAMQVNINVQKEDAPATGSGQDGGNFMRSMMNHQSISTDDRGFFRVSGLAPGKYRIAAVQPAEMSGSGLGEMGLSDPNGLQYYSGDTLHRKLAKVYELLAGEEISGIDIRVPIDGLHTVRGMLTDATGRAIGSAALTLTDTTDAALVFHAQLEEDGSFKVKEVPPGSYTLAASEAMTTSVPSKAQPFRTFENGSVAVIVLDKDADDIRLALPAKSTIVKPQPDLPHTGLPQAGSPQTALPEDQE